MHAGECSEMPVFHRDDTLERKAVGYAEVVQSSGRSVPLSFGACLHMQSLSECTMSFLLGSAASFTVDWFLFRSRGQATGVGNGPDVRCMVEWQRCSRSTCPGCREGAGALLAALLPGIPLLGGGGGGRGITPAPSRRHRGLPVLRSQCSPICSGASRNRRSALGRGRLGPSWSNLLRSASPLPAPSLRPDAHRRPQRSDTTRHLSS
ncbi:uncharacterized protein LOC121085300 isoform X2 [Falco naumanni]|uniref:uncharacterized protein LOC121085300 isoform X2 n=1 Tax=Falco naumanni TaxID=148594 RepID=UPI001ADDF231|nr:uncharacterized protein LOC121085300 isoform X2 [Falco naumanni]